MEDHTAAVLGLWCKPDTLAELYAHDDFATCV